MAGCRSDGHPTVQDIESQELFATDHRPDGLFENGDLLCAVHAANLEGTPSAEAGRSFCASIRRATGIRRVIMLVPVVVIVIVTMVVAVRLVMIARIGVGHNSLPWALSLFWTR
jgi:hypothetical protein